MLGVSLRHRGEDVLALPGGVDGYRAGHQTGLPLLAPWANRLGAWRYSVDGIDVDLRGPALHDDGHGLPIHGTMTAQAGWQVEVFGAHRLHARFAYGERPDLLAAFPFPHDIDVEVTLDGGALSITTSVRPTGSTAVPVSFGWHPYLRAPGARSRWKLRLPPCDHVALDDRGLPTGESQAQPATAASLADSTFDDLYELADDRTLSITGGDRRVSVEVGAGYGYAQVYAPAGRDFVCLEPMSAPVNALVTGDHPVVEPGASFVAEFSIVPEVLV